MPASNTLPEHMLAQTLSWIESISLSEAQCDEAAGTICQRQMSWFAKWYASVA